jgi:hypothetical protein
MTSGANEEESFDAEEKDKLKQAPPSKKKKNKPMARQSLREVSQFVD